MKGGNVNRQINICCTLPESMFHKYIYAFNGKQYGASTLKFNGGSKRLSTKYGDGKCPYKFVAWFFNDSTSLKTVSTRRPKQWVNIYNYHMSYNTINHKLRFTCDITWKFARIGTDSQESQQVWQKLNDTTG